MTIMLPPPLPEYATYIHEHGKEGITGYQSVCGTFQISMQNHILGSGYMLNENIR